MNTYKWLLQGNERFGTKAEDICRNVLKCEPKEINECVVIAPWWKPDIFKGFGGHIEDPFDGEHSNIWNIHMKEFSFTYIRTGIGAPVVGDTTLALGCTPCKKAIFIGSAGALVENMFGQAIYPNETLNNKIITLTDSICAKNNVKWHKSTNFSCDTIFAQFAHLDEIIGLGCSTIEMETAAFFKASEIAGIEAGAIFSISDNSLHKKSLYSGRSQEEMLYRHEVRARVIPSIILEVFRD
jgi:nucleoside phosphorylase